MIKLLTVKGAVQGVGFRPFIAASAKEYSIKGYVKNIGAGVDILAMGDESDVLSFVEKIKNSPPKGSFILSLTERSESDSDRDYLSSCTSFSIIDSSPEDLSGEIPVFLPDIGICDDCMKEMLDKSDRRYRYPLISCALCGPRMSILNFLPYDRKSTTMKEFNMCPDCAREYEEGRRKYAQTISCHNCGPQYIFKEKNSELFGEKGIERAVEILKKGGVIGLKGVSGYQLLALPTSKSAARLRRVKGREKKPFALMFRDICDIRKYSEVSETEEALLKSSARPIVLLNGTFSFPFEVSGQSRYIGSFLPSAGIHRLLLEEISPLIVTSANISDMPIITDEPGFDQTFLSANADDVCADGCLFHHRKINIPQDDSVLFTIKTKRGEYAQFIRRSRGYVPMPVFIPGDDISSDRTVFAFGGDLKSTFCIAHKNRALMSGHIGDLSDLETGQNYRGESRLFKKIFMQEPNLFVCDMHRSYFSSGMARKMDLKPGQELIELQHHFAHTYSVMAENGLVNSIGVSFDGTGYGSDNKIWGGEFVICKGKEHKRLGHLSYITLAGGNEAPKHARSVQKCYEFGAGPSNIKAGSMERKDDLVFAALKNGINTFDTSSMGRLFDAVSSLLGISGYNSYEGECAILLENAAWEFAHATSESEAPAFEFSVTEENGELVADQQKLFFDIKNYYRDHIHEVNAIAYAFHRAITDLIVKMCVRIRERTGENKVSLSGGVFNNRLLLTESINELENNGFEVFWNRLVPLGDGGISLGQAYYGLLTTRK